MRNMRKAVKPNRLSDSLLCGNAPARYLLQASRLISATLSPKFCIVNIEFEVANV